MNTWKFIILYIRIPFVRSVEIFSHKIDIFVEILIKYVTRFTRTAWRQYFVLFIVLKSKTGIIRVETQEHFTQPRLLRSWGITKRNRNDIANIRANLSRLVISTKGFFFSSRSVRNRDRRARRILYKLIFAPSHFFPLFRAFFLSLRRRFALPVESEPLYAVAGNRVTRRLIEWE